MSYIYSNNSFVGKMFDVDLFECSSVPVGLVYPSCKKDCNKLGKRKRSLCFSGFVFLKSLNRVLIHPSMTFQIKKEFSQNRIPLEEFFKKNVL